MYKIKIINLDRRPDRWEKVSSEFRSKGYENFERVSAVDGQNLTLTSEQNKMFKNNSFKSRKGVLGCYLSHFNLWKELKNSDSDYYLICEDDIHLDVNFKKYLDNIYPECLEKQYNAILFGYTTDKDYVRNFYEHGEDRIYIMPLRRREFIWGGAFCYLIHKNWATELVNRIESKGVKDPADIELINGETFISAPSIVFTDYMTSFKEVDSDIQYDLTSIDDNYEFYRMKDSFGHDIEFVGQKPIQELKQICDANPKCVGFNTLGYMKHKIVHPDNFMNLNYANKGGGLYVKKDRWIVE